MAEPLLDAIVLSGGSPQPEAVCRHAGVDRKSLIKIAGRQMLLYVLAALADSGCVGRAIVVGVRREDLLSSSPPLPTVFVAAGPSLLPSVEAGLSITSGERVLLCASDIPLLTGQAIRDFLARCAHADADIHYAIVERSAMEERFPKSGRHYRPLRDGSYAGGDVMLIMPDVFSARGQWFVRMFAARKSCIWLAGLFGWRTLLAFLFHRLTLGDVERHVSVALGCRCKAIISPFPEIAMDVDNVYQLDRVTAEIIQQREFLHV